MKGINFEEWKALVKKNRQALNTKSNIYRTEPESLVWGGPGANKADEYLQMHTITYSVTGMDVPSDWPTEIMSTKTLSLSIPDGYEMVELGIDGTTLDDYEYENGVITVNNVQHDLHVALTVSPPINANGHEYVDLGLPSGTLWATMNVGASSATEYGNYYMYGMGSKTYNSYGSTDTPYDGVEDPLDLSKDTARQVWGGDWHMPTQIQLQELVSNTTRQWINNYQDSGINGSKFTAQNGNYIFIPAAGSNGWTNGTLSNTCSSTPIGETTVYVLGTATGSRDIYYGARTNGYSVRPVIG